ncbi:kinase-like domain-containing protein [Calycina marina]|uniref:cyclin-dependent kinase n=1 Tax=Calycina marina TaxID=1763456 RepID=A0A9P7YYM7_9HELO|nr:kinase-like domain-containing protein [Calycina marina]
MASTDSWRSQLSAVDRYGKIELLKKMIEARGQVATGTAMKTVIAAENDAYKASASKEEYEAACSTSIVPDGPSLSPSTQEDVSGITIGPYQNCLHISDGLISSVYRSKLVALKVITETHDIAPHDPQREVAILKALHHPAIIPLTTSFRDTSSRLVLVFPYQPSTLSEFINEAPISLRLTKSIFHAIFSGLHYLHYQGLIHRDIKPANILLNPTSRAIIADFGTAWHPTLSLPAEPAARKILEVGTTCYRAPETLFGNYAYTSALDIWSTGAMLAECLRSPPSPLFVSPPAHQDGNQLGLILSMFKTLGTPTRASWPEAKTFTTPPFEWYNEFPGENWEKLLPGAKDEARELVKGLVRYESGRRFTAEQALEQSFFREEEAGGQ